jgi:hypothetical protein
MIDSDYEAHNSDPDVMLTPDSGRDSIAPGKKARRQPKGSVGKVTKTKVSSRRVSGASILGVRKNAPTKKASNNQARRRQALVEQTDRQYGSDTEEVEEFIDQDESEMIDDLNTPPIHTKKSTGRKPSTTKATKNTTQRVKEKTSKGIPAHTGHTIDEEESTPEATHRTARAATVTSSTIAKIPSLGKNQTSIGSRSVANKYASERVVPETQMDVDTSALTLEEDNEVQPNPRPTIRHPSRAQSVSKTRQFPSCQSAVGRKLAGSGSDAERGGRSDPLLRRKLGDITKKFENLDVKYRNLREVGVKEAESNLEKLKKSTAERIKGTLAITRHTDSLMLTLPSCRKPHYFAPE